MGAFDWIVMPWVYKVQTKKGLDPKVIARYCNLYSSKNISLVVVNNKVGKAIRNIRLSLRQGDLTSMHFFAYGIDPLLIFLNKRLTGILIYSLPVSGPIESDGYPLVPQEQRYKIVGYADDCKPAVVNWDEVRLVDESSALFERSSGCKLHRDPSLNKC